MLLCTMTRLGYLLVPASLLRYRWKVRYEGSSYGERIQEQKGHQNSTLCRQPQPTLCLYLDYISLNEHMLKGIKIKKAEKNQQKENLVDELKAAHQHLLELFVQGYPDTKPTVDRIHQLEQKYFHQLMNQDINIGEDQQQPISNSFAPTYKPQQTFEQPSKAEKTKPFKFSANKKLETCSWCPENQLQCVVSSSTSTYLSIVKRKQFPKYFHLCICPIEHIPSSLSLETSVLDEINNYKKCLIHMFDSIDYHPVFFETYTHKNAHLYIECLAVPSKRAGDFPFYFKQGLEGCEGDWGTNKNIIQIRKQKGGLVKQIPRNFRYFYIDFSLGYGYTHIIEDEKNWKPNFCLQIMASLLGMQKHEILTTEEYSHDELNKRVVQFTNLWKDYDWTAI